MTIRPELITQETLIPYPNGMARLFLRLPLIAYRLGLGDVMNAAHLMILGTRGRKSGRARYTAIEYRQHGSKLYLVSAWRERPHWLQNLKATPDVLVQQGRHSFAAHAEIVTNAGEALRVLHLFRRRAPFIYDPIIARLSAREHIDARTLPEITQEITIVRIDPTPGAPDLDPLPADYGWVMPTILALGVVVMLVIGLTRSHSQGDN